MSSSAVFCVVCVYRPLPGCPKQGKSRDNNPGTFGLGVFFFFVMNDRPLSSLYLGERLECSFTPRIIIAKDITVFLPQFARMICCSRRRRPGSGYTKLRFNVAKGNRWPEPSHDEG